MDDASKLPALAVAMNFRDLTQTTVNELRRAANMVESRIEKNPEPVSVDETMTRGDGIRILGSFPQSKSFWDDCAHKLVCFTCIFSHKSNGEAVNRTNWMTKTVKKEGKHHTVAFCPACTTGHPWIIHSETEYSILRVDVTEDKTHTTLTQQKKLRTSENWKECPKETPHYKDHWDLADRYDKPFDWVSKVMSITGKYNGMTRKR